MTNLIVVPGSEEGTRNINLFGIAGFFVNNHPTALPDEEHKKYAFGGYFHSLEDKTLKGRLVDNFGDSIITGRMDSSHLSFIKSYTSGPTKGELEYGFEFQNGIWVGSYAYSDHRAVGGNAKCIISLISAQCDSLQNEPRTYLGRPY